MEISKQEITAYKKFKKDFKKDEGKEPSVELRKINNNEKDYCIINNINNSFIIQK